MNRKMEENKPKRPRRTRAEIEAKVFDAIRQLADTKGLSNINFADICQYADGQPIVFGHFPSVVQVDGISRHGSIRSVVGIIDRVDGGRIQFSIIDIR